jgi:hypothetical protein
MAIISRNTLGASILFLLVSLAPMAQAQDLPQDIISISMDQALSLNVGRLFRVADWPDYPPLPVGVLPLSPGVQVDADGNATNLFFSASAGAIFLDDRALRYRRSLRPP